MSNKNKNTKDDTNNNSNNKENKTRRIIIIGFIVLDLLIVLFLLLFFLIKYNNKDNKGSSDSATSLSINESQYKNFYNYLISVSNDYMEVYYNKSSYTDYINAVSIDADALMYSCITPSKDEASIFTYALNKSSLEDVIQLYNSSELDLSLLEVEVELYSKDNNKPSSDKNHFYGISMTDPNKKCHTATYKSDDNTYVSGIDLFDNEDNVVSSNKVSANASTPLTYVLLEYISNL